MDLSFQLYSARNFLPWEGVLNTLAALGYAGVEGFGACYADPPTFRALLDKAGLAMPSGHFALDQLEADLPAALAIARTLGMTRLYCPYVPPQERPADAAGWAAFARRLALVDDRVRDAGFAFGWHNHDFEFALTPDGAMPMELILDTAPGLDWEADIAWIVRGGADPFDWIARHRARIAAAHVKDIAPPGENLAEDGWADIGHGLLDWPALLGALRAAGCDLFVVEHDNPADLARFAGRSIDSLRRF